MDIKVITRHAPSNYGSLLQSIATLRVFKKLGHDCTVIDYRRKDEQGINSVLSPLKGKAEWNANFAKKILYVLLRYPENKVAEIKFGKMRNHFLKMTRKCERLQDLKSLSADCFVTGSDQVWGPTMNGDFDEAYFLSFASNCRKIAYAASFGKTQFTENTVVAYEKLLKRYNAIAVREDSAVKMLNEWQIPCEGQVLDPTLMMTGEEWCQFIDKDIDGQYVLVYQLHNNPKLCDYAKRFAKQVGLPLLRVSPTFHQFKWGGKFMYLPNLPEFLSLIKNSSYMITDSFHGTAFALNFNKQFIEILPNTKTGSRNQSILNLTGLTDRIVTDYEDFSIAKREINYVKVNEILAKERKKSLNILKKMLSE